MKPHEITARELQAQLVDLYDFLSIKSREILDTVNGDPYKLDSEGSYEFGRADGVCHLYFPRGYIGREPPHPAMASGKCFQWEPKEEDKQLTIFDLEE